MRLGYHRRLTGDVSWITQSSSRDIGFIGRVNISSERDIARSHSPRDRLWNFFVAAAVLELKDMLMKAYLANLPTAFWVLAALPALVVTRCVMAAVVPQVVHAIVPDVVRTVLRII